MKPFRKSLAILLMIPLLSASLNVFTGCSEKQPVMKEFEKTTPEDQGMDSNKLLEAVQSIRSNALDVHHMVVLKNGKLVTEAAFYPYKKDIKHIIYSCTKSVTSILVGIAIKEGSIKSVDQKVVDFFPDREIKHLDDKKKSMTVKHLLTMTAGLQWHEEGGQYGADFDSTTQMMKSSHPVQYVLDLPMAQEPGSKFYYNTGASHLLSAIIEKATGMKTSDYAKEKLFTPLGIQDFHWKEDATGISYGGTGLYLLPGDMAKLGYLYLKKGLWNGEPLVPAEWVDASTKKQAPDKNYGYQWWIDSDGGYSARGFGGQYLFVAPDKDLVTVFNSGLYSDYAFPESIFKGYIRTAELKNATQGKDIKGYTELGKLLDEIQKEPAAGDSVKHPEIASKVSGKVFQMEDGSTLTFQFNQDPSKNFIIIDDDGEMLTYPLSPDDVYRRVDLGKKGPFSSGNMAAAKGQWSDKNTFLLQVKSLSQADEISYYYTFENNKSLEMLTSSKLFGGEPRRIKGSLQHGN